jgi:hypothetical protein
MTSESLWQAVQGVNCAPHEPRGVRLTGRGYPVQGLPPHPEQRTDSQRGSAQTRARGRIAIVRPREGPRLLSAGWLGGGVVRGDGDCRRRR